MKIYRIATSLAEEYEIKYPVASGIIDGLKITSNVPNSSSISSTLNDWHTLKGIRSVPMSDFNVNGHSYSVSENKRIDELKNEISSSKTISPLIVVVEKEGPYILEGSHRIDALYLLGIKHFPAMVVINIEEEA